MIQENIQSLIDGINTDVNALNSAGSCVPLLKNICDMYPTVDNNPPYSGLYP